MGLFSKFLFFAWGCFSIFFADASGFAAMLRGLAPVRLSATADPIDGGQHVSWLTVEPEPFRTRPKIERKSFAGEAQHRACASGA
jgi:hypothetical protein